MNLLQLFGEGLNRGFLLLQVVGGKERGKRLQACRVTRQYGFDLFRDILRVQELMVLKLGKDFFLVGIVKAKSKEDDRQQDETGQGNRDPISFHPSSREKLAKHVIPHEDTESFFENK